MSVYLTIPSARPVPEAEACLAKWRERGYKLAIWRDAEPVNCDVLLTGLYPGYARAVNTLAREVLLRDPECSWMIAAGDDTEPDPNHTPEQIAAECIAHFGGTFGIMQPTGDRWGEDARMPNLHPMRSAYIDRVCGSPWIGREFAQRMYGGKGPYYEEYQHMFVDEELQGVAVKLGVLWQRRDLIHYHRHWARETNRRARVMPAFLKEANTPGHWGRFQSMFRLRQSQGFPGSEPLPA